MVNWRKENFRQEVAALGVSRIPAGGKALIGRQQQRLKRLRDMLWLQEQCSNTVLQKVEALQEKQVGLLLRQIPVEALNRDKRGIRTKTLRDRGYENLDQIRSASAFQLEAINGISAEGAGIIRFLTEDVAEKARKSARIRLSRDDRNPDSTELLRGLCRYRDIRPVREQAETLLKTYEKDLNLAVSAVTKVCGTFKWLFSSGKTRESGWLGYEYLQRMDGAEFGPAADSLIRQVMLDWNRSDEAVWQCFEKDAISLYGILEELAPGVLGTEEEGGCGLPELLAQEIRQEQPDLTGLKCTLRRYQKWGVRYILHQKKVLLGDEMGLGKTVQAIAALVARRNAGDSHFLVICPASVLENWCREIRKHSDLPVYRIYGEEKHQILDRWTMEGGVGVTTYEGAEAVLEKYNLVLGMLVVDEAHYIKNPRAQRSQRVRKLCRQARRLLFMTGTALENRVEEMISLLEVLQPAVAERAGALAVLSAAPQFREAVAPVYYRRKREDVLQELPELIETEQWCTLQGEEKLLYEQAVLRDQYTEARRVSWNVTDPAASSKGRRMLELIEQAREEGRKVIVFSFFLDTIEKVRALAGECCLPPINGSVTPQKRQEIVDAFEKAPAGAVLPAQIQAGGTGLNIQAASVVILCEPQFKPSMENQAISRAYRMGQTRNVLVYRLLAEDTVDERILQLLAQKQLAFDAYADESVAGQESLELDASAFGTIMLEEKERIRQQMLPGGTEEAKSLPEPEEKP